MLPALKASSSTFEVLIDVDADAAEIVAALVDGQILAPIIRDQLVGDRAAGIDGDHLIGPAAERRLHRGLLELVALVIFPRQHGQLADDERQLAVVARREGELDLVRVERLRLHHALVVDAVARMALALQRVEGPHDVVRRERTAVVEARLGPQVEDHPSAIHRHLDLLREQTVFGEGLVLALHRQRIEEPADAGCRDALEDEAVEAVEGAERALMHLAALGRVGVGVVEMGEAGRVFRVAMHGDGGADIDVRLRRRGGPEETREKREREDKGGRDSHDGLGLLMHGRENGGFAAPHQARRS